MNVEKLSDVEYVIILDMFKIDPLLIKNHIRDNSRNDIVNEEVIHSIKVRIKIFQGKNLKVLITLDIENR